LLEGQEEKRFMAAFEVLLFDLGGVLIEVAGLSTMLDWTGLDRDSLWRRWLASPSVRRFEKGQSSAQDFAEQVVSEFALPVTPTEFLEFFERWPMGLYEGIEPLLQSLSDTYRLACLSNTNEVHWPRMRDQFGLGRLLDRAFVSHEIGMVKPDPQTFQHVIHTLDCPPEAIAFFDDNAVNVQGAAQHGINAYLTRGPADLSAKLGTLGIL
jgi:HAD superfamily hydrolase (TIGR01509 family)